jgi:uncharacterized repeat protein (TIGR03803 family)
MASNAASTKFPRSAPVLLITSSVAMLVFASFSLAAARPPETYSEILQFSGKDGAAPQSGVITGANGVLYGVAASGGAAGQGVAYSLTPPSNGAKQWTKTVLYEFKGGTADGGEPVGGLVADRNGVLYGTTYLGGNAGYGTAFKLTPPGPGGSHWSEQILYNFQGFPTGDGAYPFGNLIIDNSGALYGTTTQGGGAAGPGTVFKLTPPTTSVGQWAETILYSFTYDGTNSDGAVPTAGVTFGPGGVLYGTASGGGVAQSGIVFELAPPVSPATNWTESVLFQFGDQAGGLPAGGVTLGPDGSLYGTAEAQGANNWGVVYKLSPPKPGQTAWTGTALYAFTGQDGGGNPAGPLVLGTNGALYGTTTIGGGPLGGGTVYMLAPPAHGKSNWTFTQLYQFQTSAEGATPFGGVTFGAGGALFGTTSAGGNDTGLGAVFELQ